MKKFDFIIVGGGIIGMTTARELAFAVQALPYLIRVKLGQEASWAAGGILSSMRPWTENPLQLNCLSMAKYSIRIYEYI